MNNIMSFGEFLMESISPLISKSKDREMNRLFRTLSSVSKKRLEASGNLLSISFEDTQDPLDPNLSGDFLTFRFSDINDPIPFPYIFSSAVMGDSSYSISVPSEDELKRYLSWVGEKIGNSDFYNDEKIGIYLGGLYKHPGDAGHYDYYLREIASQILDCYYERYKREIGSLDISGLEYRESEQYKDLIKLGCKETTSDRQLKNGTIQFSIESGRTYMINSNGYMRTRWGSDGRVTVILSNSKEANKPIENMDILLLKFRILYLYILKNDILPGTGLDPKEINKIMKMSVDPSDPGYKDFYDNAVRQKPLLSLYLTPPSDGYNEKMIKGAKLLKSMNLF